MSYLALALVMILLGSCVRFSQAGPPAWAVCCSHTRTGGSVARTSQPNAPYAKQSLGTAKANQGGHRSTIGVLGLLALMLVGVGMRRGRHQALLTVVAGLVLFQALLGMGSMVMKLMPLAVTDALVGGTSLLALLGGVLFHRRYRKRSTHGTSPRHVPISIIRVFTVIGLMLALITLNHRLNFPLAGSPAREPKGELS